MYVVPGESLSERPVRCAKFVARQQWVLAGADSGQLSVYSVAPDTCLTKIHDFEAHPEYLRYIAVHPERSYVLTCADDSLIKLWNWDEDWQCMMTFAGHLHYVMMCQWHPTEGRFFVSCSLDSTIKGWSTDSTAERFSLRGHERGVNCVSFGRDGTQIFLISGSDDHTVQVWDYSHQECLQTLSSHTRSITAAFFHPTLPIILTASEDSTIKVWSTADYRLESTLLVGARTRVWSCAWREGSQALAIGSDSGAVMLELHGDALQKKRGKAKNGKKRTLRVCQASVVQTMLAREEGSSVVVGQAILCQPGKEAEHAIPPTMLGASTYAPAEFQERWQKHYMELQYHIQAPAAKGLALSCCRTCCFGMSVLAAFISCCALPLMFYNLHPFAACFGCVLLAALFFPYARDLWGRLTDDMNYGEVPPDCKCANIAMLWGIAAVCVTAILALRY